MEVVLSAMLHFISVVDRLFMQVTQGTVLKYQVRIIASH